MTETIKPKRAMSIVRVVMWLCVLAVTGFVVREMLATMAQENSSDAAQRNMSRSTGLVDPTSKHLAAGFTDSHDRLLADSPAAAQLRDPQSIVLAHIVSSDSETPGVNWAQFEAFLAEQTGRKVVDQPFTNSAADLSKIKKGEITVLALHAADAPFLVNNYGYQPMAALGDESGASGNHLDVIVKAGSPLTKLGDIKGRSLTCTVPSSITGYRAAIALLAKNEDLKPMIDYQILWSMKQKESIKGVIDGHIEAAAASDDKVQSMLKSGKISLTSFKTIYSSQVIPRTTIGWFYDLKPELAGKINNAIVAYRPDATASAKPAAHTSKSDAAAGDTETDASDDTGGKPLHFIAIDYKKDFQLVRDIDDRFDPRLDAQAMAKQSASAATQP